MLNAILAGKAATIEAKPGETVSWKTLYRSREDLLTATIIERLSYLPASLFFKLLRSASIPNGALPKALGQLVELEFWPTLTRPDQEGSTVEPDAILTFERGVLIIEAKIADRAMHRAEQWAQEWAAYHYAISSEELTSATDKGDVYLIALGGIERSDFHTLTELTSRAQQLLDSRTPGITPELKAAGCSWFELSEAIRRERKARDGVWDDSGLRMILKDLDEAFRLHEFRGAQWIEGLANWPLASCDDALGILAPAFTRAEEHQTAPPADWQVLHQLTPIMADATDIRRLGNA
jgi:hypothetical protein